MSRPVRHCTRRFVRKRKAHRRRTAFRVTRRSACLGRPRVQVAYRLRRDFLSPHAKILHAVRFRLIPCTIILRRESVRRCFSPTQPTVFYFPPTRTRTRTESTTDPKTDTGHGSCFSILLNSDLFDSGLSSSQASNTL